MLLALVAELPLAAWLAIIAILVISGLAVLWLSATPCRLERLPGEQNFVTPSGEGIPVPKLDAPPTLYLSLIVPAYKETLRLPGMLDETMSYLRKRQAADASFSFEIIVVDDGSKDGTTQCALEYVDKYGRDVIRVLRLDRNRGKGGAVRMGMLSARGRRLLMLDADAATDINDFVLCENRLKEVEKDGWGIVVGSRAHLEEEATAQRTLFRNLLMHGFHFLVYILCVRGIRDTQCGFKLFTRKSAIRTFTALHLERWSVW